MQALRKPVSFFKSEKPYLLCVDARIVNSGEADLQITSHLKMYVPCSPYKARHTSVLFGYYPFKRKVEEQRCSDQS